MPAPTVYDVVTNLGPDTMVIRDVTVTIAAAGNYLAAANGFALADTLGAYLWALYSPNSVSGRSMHKDLRWILPIGETLTIQTFDINTYVTVNGYQLTP